MLFGEKLGRGHQSRLVTMHSCHPCRQEGQNRFSAPNIPLQKPVHRRATGQVSENFFPSPILTAGQLERQTA